MPGPFECVIFDCDSTLTKAEGIDLLASKEIQKKIADLTSAAMGGKKDFHEIYRKRLEMLRPNLGEVNQLGKKYIELVVEDAKETVAALHFLKKRVFVISGGFRLALASFTSFLGIPGERVFGVDLFFDDSGNYLGFDEANRLTFNKGKTEVVRDLSGSGKKAVFIGDGVTDWESSEVVELFVGFGGVICRPEVEKKALYYVKAASLSVVLAAILTPFEQKKLAGEPRFRKLMKRALESAEAGGLISHA